MHLYSADGTVAKDGGVRGEGRGGRGGAFYEFQSQRTGRKHLSLGRGTASHDGGRFQEGETAEHLTVTARRTGSSFGWKPLPSRPEITKPIAAGTSDVLKLQSTFLEASGSAVG
jgi:hypothetical protein